LLDEQGCGRLHWSGRGFLGSIFDNSVAPKQANASVRTPLRRDALLAIESVRTGRLRFRLWLESKFFESCL